LQIFTNGCRCTNHAAWFTDAYRKALNGAQAAWANKRYHGHRVLSEEILASLDEVGVV